MGGKKLQGTYVGNLATGDTDPSGQGTIDEHGAAVPNLSSTGSNTSTARVNGNLAMNFGNVTIG